MTNLRNDFFDQLISRYCDLSQLGSQFVMVFGGDSDGIPKEIGVPFSQLVPFSRRRFQLSIKRQPFLKQEFMSIQIGQSHIRIEPRAASAPFHFKVVDVVPLVALNVEDDFSLTEVLTFDKCLTRIRVPFSRQRVWPLVTACVDDAPQRCSRVAWLYTPDTGTFPAEWSSFPDLLGLLFISRKVSRCEVSHGHAA